jgi:hypothetical protein
LIDAAVEDKVSYAVIGRRYGVSKRAVARHFKSGHLEKTEELRRLRTKTSDWKAGPKRSGTQLALDREWISRLAGQGFGAYAIHQTAKQEGRTSVAECSLRTVEKDLRWIRRQALLKTVGNEQALLERTKLELARVAFGNHRQIMGWGPDGAPIVNSDDLSEDEAALVQAVTFKQDGDDVEIKIKTHNKIQALNGLARLLAPLRFEVGEPGDFRSKVKVAIGGGEGAEKFLAKVLGEDEADS